MTVVAVALAMLCHTKCTDEWNGRSRSKMNELDLGLYK